MTKSQCSSTTTTKQQTAESRTYRHLLVHSPHTLYSEDALARESAETRAKPAVNLTILLGREFGVRCVALLLVLCRVLRESSEGFVEGAEEGRGVV